MLKKSVLIISLCLFVFACKAAKEESPVYDKKKMAALRFGIVLGSKFSQSTSPLKKLSLMGFYCDADCISSLLMAMGVKENGIKSFVSSYTAYKATGVDEFQDSILVPLRDNVTKYFESQNETETNKIIRIGLNVGSASELAASFRNMKVEYQTNEWAKKYKNTISPYWFATVPDDIIIVKLPNPIKQKVIGITHEIQTVNDFTALQRICDYSNEIYSLTQNP